MSLQLIRPIYPCEPIKSIPKLALALGISESTLLEIATRANGMYREVPITKGEKTRLTYDALGDLKTIQKRINQKILARVIFPDYLQGSLKGRDYVTNAALHTKKKIVACEDVENFFPSVKAGLVADIWENFFHFSKDASLLLTQLTTKDGAIPQGTSTSSYLANLALWRHEPGVQVKLANMGIVYSRYVDDIAMSSAAFLSKDKQSKAIAMVYAMLKIHGLSASRKKHEFFSSNGRMTVTKLLVNQKPSLGREKRLNIRSQVHHAITLAARYGATHIEAKIALDRAAQAVGQLGRFHLTAAQSLKMKIKDARKISVK